MNWKQLLNDSNCDVTAPAAEFAGSLTEGRIGAVHWEDFLTDATALTYLKETGQGLIKIILGYLPPADVTMPFEPYLRGLIHLFWQNALSEDDFWEQMQDHVKLIRNADMKHHVCIDYHENIYRNYHETFATYGYAVRERLSSFLGYEPELRYSLAAELWLRDIMSNDTYKMPQEMTENDVRAITLIKYRELLLRESKEVADTSSIAIEILNDMRKF